jgi:hypothetical protein
MSKPKSRGETPEASSDAQTDPQTGATLECAELNGPLRPL